MSLDRSAILRSIIEYQLPIEPSVEQLRRLGWDTDQVYAVVTCEDVGLASTERKSKLGDNLLSLLR